MRLLFAILSILLFLIGMKTHKKIHAIAGVVFMAMLLASIVMEMANEGRVSEWFAAIRGSMIQDNGDFEDTKETTSSSLETEEEEIGSTGGMTEEAPDAAKETAPEKTAVPTEPPGMEGMASPTRPPAQKETPSPAKTSAPKETPDATGELMREEGADQEKTPVPSPVKTADPSPWKNDEAKTYRPEDYGVVEKEKQEFQGEDGEVSYYYMMESFYLSDTFSRRVNVTLEKIYDEYEAQYLRTGELIQSGFDEFDESAKPDSGTPYDYWQLVGLKYAGKDYISILYNDIPYMSNTHPYSRFDGITINCRTGKEVTASEFLEKSDQEILEEVSSKMGLADTATWDDIDFYLTDSAIVFIYRVPDWWEDVVIPRE